MPRSFMGILDPSPTPPCGKAGSLLPRGPSTTSSRTEAPSNVRSRTATRAGGSGILRGITSVSTGTTSGDRAGPGSTSTRPCPSNRRRTASCPSCPGSPRCWGSSAKPLLLGLFLSPSGKLFFSLCFFGGFSLCGLLFAGGLCFLFGHVLRRAFPSWMQDESLVVLGLR